MSNFITFNLENWPILLLDIKRAPADDQEWLQYEADMLEVYSVAQEFSVILNIHATVPWRYVLLQGIFMKSHTNLSQKYLKHIKVLVKTVTANALLHAFLQIHHPVMPVDIQYAQ
jgi:hypothetical protein